MAPLALLTFPMAEVAPLAAAAAAPAAVAAASMAAAAFPSCLSRRRLPSRLSYGTVNSLANQLARRLAEVGVTADVAVGVSLPKSVRLYISLLAVLKAGGCYVPLDPGLPAERAAFMLKQAGARMLLTDPGSSISEVSSVQTMHVGDPMTADWQCGSLPDGNLPLRCTPADLYSIIYTRSETTSYCACMHVRACRLLLQLAPYSHEQIVSRITKTDRHLSTTGNHPENLELALVLPEQHAACQVSTLCELHAVDPRGCRRACSRCTWGWCTCCGSSQPCVQRSAVAAQCSCNRWPASVTAGEVALHAQAACMQRR